MTPHDADAVLEALDPEQRAVATAVRGPVCVLAGAGTGKTRAITHRIAYAVRAGMVLPGHVLAVTFTNRAAGEMRVRLRALGAGGVQALTFHAAARRQLAYFWPRVIGGGLPRLVEGKASLLAEAVARCGLDAHRTEIRDFAAEVEWAKVTQTVPEDYAAVAGKADRTPPRDLATMARVYATYEEVKRHRNCIDFEDILLLTAGVLADRDDVAGEVRARYRWFVVDEYQDVSPLQQRLLDLWLGGREDLCVVGDPSQTIYSFTGATPEFLLGFPQRYPQATVVHLVRDYRSTPQVVRLANAMLSAGGAPGGSGMAPVAHGLQLIAQRPDGPDPRFTEYPDETAEAEGAARQIRALLDAGVPASDVAVLFRTNAQSATYEQAMADAGVPCVLRGGERFFERREVREAMLVLRGAARAGDGSGAGPLAEPLAGEVRRTLASVGWSEQPPTGSGAVRDRWESLSALVRLAEEFAATMSEEVSATMSEEVSATMSTDSPASLRAFVAELDGRAAAAYAPTVEGVTLASLHAAKGLEWDAVFLVGLTEGMVPIAYAETPEQVEEERRLLYVGITRARVRLALSWAVARTPGGRGGRRPSRFLEALRGAPPRGRAGRVGRTARSAEPSGPARCRVCRKPLTAPAERKIGRCESCPVAVDEALLERLRTWRREQAREQRVPAFCVFTDATLTVIAETRPTTAAELATVPGVGRAKLEKYGTDVLELCEAPQTPSVEGAG